MRRARTRSIRHIQVVQNYVGVTDAAVEQPGKGKELALAQIGKGADVIFAAAGNSGLAPSTRSSSRTGDRRDACSSSASIRTRTW